MASAGSAKLAPEYGSVGIDVVNFAALVARHA